MPNCNVRFGSTWKSALVTAMSVISPTVTTLRTSREARFGPNPDIVDVSPKKPCVRPFNAVHMTAGHNALRGSGPDQQLAFKNAMAQVGCPDRRIDRLCITCCSPSQPSHHASCPARSRLSRKRDGFLVSLAFDHHGPNRSELIKWCALSFLFSVRFERSDLIRPIAALPSGGSGEL